MSDHPTTAPGDDEYGPVDPQPDRDDVSEQSTVKSPEYAAENDDD
jgi:hypothetical protein